MSRCGRNHLLISQPLLYAAVSIEFSTVDGNLQVKNVCFVLAD